MRLAIEDSEPHRTRCGRPTCRRNNLLHMKVGIPSAVGQTANPNRLEHRLQSNPPNQNLKIRPPSLPRNIPLNLARTLVQLMPRLAVWRHSLGMTGQTPSHQTQTIALSTPSNSALEIPRAHALCFRRRPRVPAKGQTELTQLHTSLSDRRPQCRERETAKYMLQLHRS